MLRTRFPIAIIAASFCTCFVPTVQGQDIRPIHRWSLDNSLADTGTVGGLDLSLAGLLPGDEPFFQTDIPPISNNAPTNSLEFSGLTDSFARATNNGEPFTEDMTHTVVLWAKHDSFDELVAQRWISWGNCCNPPSNRRYFFGPGGGSKVDLGYISTTAADGPVPAIVQWDHWAAVRDLPNEKVFYYLNGVQVVEADVPAMIGDNFVIGPFDPAVGESDTNRELRVGNQFNDPTNAIEPLDGRLADLAIFDVALDAGQIQHVINNSAVSVPPPAIPTDRREWRDDVAGDWLTGGWFDPTGAAGTDAPNSNMSAPEFGAAITSPRTVFTDDPVTVNRIQFDNANSYAIAGNGTVTLETNPDGAVNPTVEVLSGSHQIQLPLALAGETTVTAADGSTLNLNNQLTLNGNDLNIDTTGTGAVNINHSVNSGGGTVTNSGTLGTAGSTTIGGDLASSGTLDFDIGGSLLDEFDSITVGGTATVSGSLHAELVNGFSLLGGESFTLLTAGTLIDNEISLIGPLVGTLNLNVIGNSLVLNGGSGAIPGDYNADEIVDTMDLNLVLFNWDSDSVPSEWSQHVPAGNVGIEELNGVLFNWNRTTPLSAVPEPHGLLMGLLGMSLLARRKKGAKTGHQTTNQ